MNNHEKPETTIETPKQKKAPTKEIKIFNSRRKAGDKTAPRFVIYEKPLPELFLNCKPQSSYQRKLDLLMATLHREEGWGFDRLANLLGVSKPAFKKAYLSGEYPTIDKTIWNRIVEKLSVVYVIKYA